MYLHLYLYLPKILNCERRRGHLMSGGVANTCRTSPSSQMTVLFCPQLNLQRAVRNLMFELSVFDL